METFVFKFICVFYLAMVVNCRYINKNYRSTGDIFGIERNETEHKNNVNREIIATTEIDRILANVNAKINYLKEEYSTEKFKTLLPNFDKVIYDYPRKTTVATADTTDDLDYIGTVQIEALLNDIKARAIQLAAEQNPSVTDMITNTVTEATFAADPILNHLEVTSPGYALTTFVCLNNMENIDKRTANESKYVIVSGDSKHSITVRSVKENAFTIAQNVEDILQKELKSIYKKVKAKVSKDFHKEVKTVQSTIKSHTSKVIDHATQIGGSKQAQLTTHKTTTGAKHNRGKKYTKDAKTTKEVETTPTIDDFAMLTLYEQILAKTHEDNVMKMLATNKKRKVDETIRLSKRNQETLTDLTLKKDVKRMYDYGDTIPDTDYNNGMLPVANNDYPTDSSPEANKYIKQVGTESTPTEDTSYQGLSDKLAYKDYVNGFKNYLKFQRDEAKQNFSALIKYQAHKHHNVDDIGKFILNKIPQIPKRKRRYFFDDSDIDDQDISTKSDDSWFKKHFYMFIDTGTPKKYHTSETVEFKDVTEANSVGYPNVIEKPYGDRHANLDELSRALHDRNASNSPYLNEAIIGSTPETRQVEENGFGFRINAPKIISKFFGKRQKEPDDESETENRKDRTLKFDDDDFLFITDLTRLQRNAVNEVSAEQKSNQTRTTLFNKQNAKVGCVSIVTQPTAIVNLYKSNPNGGKVQRLLNKLHFHKRKKNHKKKKDKRHCTRVQRFNPLRKLKDMFISKPNERVIGTKEQTDYDILRAHIDTFKPVKYDKLPSIDELRNQVPNISGNTNDIQSVLVKANNNAKDGTMKYNQSLADAETNTAMNEYTLLSPSPLHFTAEKQQKPEYTTRKLKKKPKKNKNVSPTDNVMNVNVKTANLENLFTISPTVLNDIRNELDKIQVTMTPQSYKKFRPSPKIKDKPESQLEVVNANEDNKDIDDITIKAKLTRVAKYPLNKLKRIKTNIESTGGNSELYEFDNDSYLSYEKPFPFAVAEKNTPKFSQYQKINKYGAEMSPVIASTMKVIEEDDLVTFKELVGNNKKYPDYFHDLVRWNNDILSSDKVTYPTWQDILKEIHGADEYTTTNVGLLQKELSEINEHLAFSDLGRMDGKEIAKDPIKNDAATDILHIASSPKYVAKVKNIKVEVGCNKLKNKQKFKDYDEYPHIYDHTDPKSYSNHKSQDIINVLNNLYTKHNYGIKKGQSKFKNNQVPLKGSKRTTVSTPRYSEMYLGGYTNTWIPKKISKNSVKAPKSKYKESRPIATVNQMPEQFFNTPLPMKSENFRMFLKENGLDIDNLTLPINDDDIPVVTRKWQTKMYSLSKIMNTSDVVKQKSNITESKTRNYKDDININNIDYKSYPENQIEYLNDLEQDLIEDNAIREKRFNVHDYSYPDSALIAKEIQSFKNKQRNSLDKKLDEESGSSDTVTDSNDDIEVTIINLDNEENAHDTNNILNKPYSQVLMKVNATAKNIAKLDGSSTKKANVKGVTEKEKTKLHQTLSPLKADKDTNISNVISKAEVSKDSNLKDLTMVLKELPSELNEKNKKENLPKRVQISSISYKYDVVYHPSKVIDKEEIISDKEDYIDKSTPAVADAKEIGDNTKKKTNSEMDGVTEPKSRVARSVTVTNRSTFSQTKRFTKMKQARSKRLFQMMPIIKEKLKRLGKKSSTLSMNTTTMEETATSLNANATSIKTSGTTATSKPTKRNKLASELKFNYDNIFDYKLFTINEKRNADTEAYYESSSNKTPADMARVKKLKSSGESTTEVNTYKSKRDVNSVVHTAKDVAALEVIVDLMRNTQSYAEKSPVTSNTNALLQSKTIDDNIKANMDQTTNSIQVHIAIPYDISSKKRSSDPVKVRKVFTAKLATPVDLEYQIHSLEDNIDVTTKAFDYGFSPRKYLLVDDANKGGYIFKPVEMPVEMKEYVTEKIEADTMKLSKEFVAAVNKYLMQLYENISASNYNVNKIVDRKVRDTQWDKFKKYFGHDRVCNCKCKENKPMCSTCAACDPVIKELVFEFENLAKYMSDHCTEIQTFFWMNPSSGRALRGIVHKIDKSLNDYYKRVKGKCRGCKCKAFTTFIDKRGFKYMKVNSKNYIGEPLLKDLQSLNDHLDFSVSFIPYDAILREKGDELINAVNNCIATESIGKRTDSDKSKCDDKNVYTLDNISVNIICNPDTPNVLVTSPVNHDKTIQTATKKENILLDYDIGKRNCKHKLGSKKKPLFNNLFTFYVTQAEANTLKREAKFDQIESPLIADTGGSFWRDYLNKGSVGQNNEYKTSDLEVSVVETNSEKTPAALSTFKDKLRNIRKSKTETTETTKQLVMDTTDSLSYNMNELFKLISTIQVTEDPITFTVPTIITHKKPTKHKTKKTKLKKHKKIHKTNKAKIHHKHKTKTTKILKAQTNSKGTTSNDRSISKEVKTKSKTESTFASYNIEDIIHKDVNSLPKEKSKLKSTTTKMNLFDKIRKATLGFLSNLGEGNNTQDSASVKNEKLSYLDTTDNKIGNQNTDEKFEQLISFNTIDNKKSSNKQTNIISGATTQINPTILIIDEGNTMTTVKDKSKYRSILLSLLNFESSKIDKEKERLRDEISDASQNLSYENMGEAENTIALKMQPKTELVYDIPHSIQGNEPMDLPSPPGLEVKPGLLERVVQRFGIKGVSDKVAATHTLNFMSKNQRTATLRSKRSTSEETEPTKTMKLNSNGPNRRDEFKRLQRFSSHFTSMMKPSRISHKLINNSNYIKETTEKSMKMYKTGFDRYFRNKNGIYRLRRFKNYFTERSELRTTLNYYITERFKRERTKRKRSDAEIKNSERLSVWLQHSAGFFIATITCFYIVLAAFAAVINWVFGR